MTQFPTTPAFRTFSPGEIIFREGEIGDCSFYVDSGEVEIFIERADGEHVLAVLGEDEIFGEMAIIDRLPRSASARAKTQCVLGVIQKEQLADRLASADPVVTMLVRVLIQRLRREVTTRRQTAAKKSGSAKTNSTTVVRSANRFEKNQVIQKLKIEGLIRNSIGKEEFHLKFQPIVDLHKNSLVGFEALIRWDSPEAKFLGTESFIQICEETNLIIPIGQWVAATAIEGLARLQQSWKPHAGSKDKLFVSINVSGRQIFDPTFFMNLENHRKKFGIEASQIKLEITEQLFVQSTRALDWTRKAKQLGYKLDLDDFGTGYSSFRYLGTIPFDHLKIDKSFVINMFKDPRSQLIVESILSLGQRFGIPVIAEGIESLQHVETLQKWGCELGQGYHFGRPALLDDMLKSLGQGQLPDVA